MKRNLAANIAGTAWSGLITLALVRVYIQFLGVESYGLLAFYASALVISALLDAGVGVAVNREVARRSADEAQFTGTRRVLRSAEPIYAAIALGTAAALLLASSWMSRNWFEPAGLSPEHVATTLRLMAIAIGLRFPYGLYSAVLLGAQRHVTLNVISIAAVTARGAVTLALLAWFRADVQAIMTVEIVLAALQTGAVAIAAYRVLPAPSGAAHAEAAELRRSWSFIRAVAAAGILSGLVSQTDKLVVSKVLPLTVFGAYAAAVAIGATVAMAVQPLHATFFPRLTQLLAKGADADAVRVYHRASQIMAAILFPAAIVLAIFSREILELWIGSPALALEMRWTAALLIAGSAFYALTTLMYSLQLAHGWIAPTLALNAAAVAILIPASVWSAGRYGAMGPAATWLLVNVLVLTWDAIATHGRLLPGTGGRWLWRDVAPPCVVALLVGIGARLAMPVLQPDGPPAMIALIGAAGVLAFIGAAATTEVARDWFSERGSR